MNFITPDVTEVVALDVLCCSFIHNAALRLLNNTGRWQSFVGINVQKLRLELVKMSTIESFCDQTTIAIIHS